VILEAFAKYLQAADPATPAPSILACWLVERLRQPPQTNVDRVLHCELAIEGGTKQALNRGHQQKLTCPSGQTVIALSASGGRLLKSLYEYSSSYEQQKWSRWVHRVKASDFNRLYNDD
jgi:hypothetical protein